MAKEIVLLRGKEKRVHTGHPWIFLSDIAHADAQAGDIVSVRSSNGAFLAKALYNPHSQIALRILTRRDETVDDAFIRGRVRNAVNWRKTFADLQSCRLIFAESDGLPGLIADSFGPVICVQCLSLGMDRFLDAVCDELEALLHPVGIYERGDVPVRQIEGLPYESRILRGSVPDRIEMTENGIRFLVDVKQGQKTGYFLDQKENRAAIEPFVRGKSVLDCFTHTGSFALHAAYYGASSVVGVDISGYACECAQENARLNGLENVEFREANAFDYLRSQADSGAKYDVVILDPPAFTKSRSQVEGATRGYKEINLRGMKLLQPGGILVTCSCSQHMTPPMFREVIASAARDAHLQLQLIAWRSQGRDHPILLLSPETEYLKCGIFRVL